MIEVVYADGDREHGGPFGRATLISQLEDEIGRAFRRVERPTPNVVCVMFAPLEGDDVASLAEEQRSTVIVVAEGATPEPSEAETARSALGLLGLVEPAAWRSWKRGLFVAWGLFGRPDVARAAGLVLLDSLGLQPSSGRAALPSVLARFLVAAQNR